MYHSNREKFGHKSYQEDINNYHQKGFDDEENEEEESLMDILDLLTIDENRKLEMVFELIDDLDLEVINEMKVKLIIDLHIKYHLKPEEKKFLKYGGKL